MIHNQCPACNVLLNGKTEPDDDRVCQWGHLHTQMFAEASQAHSDYPLIGIKVRQTGRAGRPGSSLDIQGRQRRIAPGKMAHNYPGLGKTGGQVRLLQDALGTGGITMAEETAVEPSSQSEIDIEKILKAMFLEENVDQFWDRASYKAAPFGDACIRIIIRVHAAKYPPEQGRYEFLVVRSNQDIVSAADPREMITGMCRSLINAVHGARDTDWREDLSRRMAEAKKFVEEELRREESILAEDIFTKGIASSAERLDREKIWEKEQRVSEAASKLPSQWGYELP